MGWSKKKGPKVLPPSKEKEEREEKSERHKRKQGHWQKLATVCSFYLCSVLLPYKLKF